MENKTSLYQVVAFLPDDKIGIDTMLEKLNELDIPCNENYETKEGNKVLAKFYFKTTPNIFEEITKTMKEATENEQ